MRTRNKQVEQSDWQLMVDAAKRGLIEAGYRLTRMPGRGMSNVWSIELDGKVQTAAIRTTRNRWFAFPPLEGGTKWKTLDDVDLVVVSAVDNAENPKRAEVYLFKAADVRKRFRAAYDARKRAGQAVRDDFGMWIGLDTDPRDLPSSVGSGLAQVSPPLATLALEEVEEPHGREAAKTQSPTRNGLEGETREPQTIVEVLAWARQKVAIIAGVRTEAVKLDLKIEY